MRARTILALFPLLTALPAYGCGSDEDDGATGGAGGSGASGSPGSSSSGTGGTGAQGGDASSSSSTASGGEGGAGTGGSGGATVGGAGGQGGTGEGGAGGAGGGSARACEDCIDAESLDCGCAPDGPPECEDWADCTEACLESDFTSACVDACEAMYPGAGAEIKGCVCIPACAAACGPVCQ